MPRRLTQEEVRWDVALTKDGNRVWIDDDCDEALFCPECNGVMIPVRGEQRQHHFRHSVESNCSGESAKHWTKKYEIADALEGIGSVIVEGKIGDYVADVLFENEWAFEVVFSNPPSEDKLRDLRENLVVFNFMDENVWSSEGIPIPGTFSDLDDQSFNGIVASLGRSAAAGETVDVCSVCREVKGWGSRLKVGGRCFPCDFGIFVDNSRKEKKAEEFASRYRDAKMR
jgi:hypothetical protein